ncbi:hypothetical protein HPB52_013149 [Rhipicephalus sanguineus]|uniref:Uncharacterized protein n=1 Tax=Rhipicephalus sanguineus TaxID=34632 RepID=A0A9D4ST09_RHISA|nr:hypothetical protein HPB52_013149 [Rhipicephalus sanguineus]
MNNDLAQPACRIQSPTESLPDTNSSGRALHQVEGTRQNEQTVAHAPELCGDSAVFVSDDVLHVVYQDVVGPVTSPISGGSRDNSIYLPPLQRRRHSSDVQSADYDHVSGAITPDDEESNVNFRQRLQAWAVESRCSHAAVTSLLTRMRAVLSLPRKDHRGTRTWSEPARMRHALGTLDEEKEEDSGMFSMVRGMNRTPTNARELSPDQQRVDRVELTPVHQRAGRRLRGDSPETRMRAVLSLPRKDHRGTRTWSEPARMRHALGTLDEEKEEDSGMFSMVFD